MATWPQLWRSDIYLMERTCPHGIGHPDPDHVGYGRATAGTYSVTGPRRHGCDGCCVPAEVTA
jgi:hypothetical protein